MRDAAAKSRFDVTHTARADDNHVCIVVLGAGHDSACDGAFLHFTDDIVNALLPRPSFRIRHQIAGNLFQDFQVRPRDMFQFRVSP